MLVRPDGAAPHPRAAVGHPDDLGLESDAETARPREEQRAAQAHDGGAMIRPQAKRLSSSGGGPRPRERAPFTGGQADLGSPGLLRARAPENKEEGSPHRCVLGAPAPTWPSRPGLDRTRHRASATSA